ncbi:L-aspartate oxidase [Candidatus Roizmanbacteria bacterium RIFCSPHIGHO2_02_FULL_37_13b]|uniref:L-aspartate oxidase n=1 Tax=Candidatus Roizmanbacteria bacterium RIFCSPLOWO2_02_FULL_36_11 TaxID=1802071 RepID=A0A1F7JBE2_9BACT|nr:MAG: L-aspartate oxidase [Candidatus Roizmanbacteria bacterium RIFCSPHIGHO2_02_FULL_37_13b]OGK52929.1 MAG: L-aspartate oxidase [Candidatus Roizmanbacteria bacterium RIFCSPLOWO2_02_FULL_36_11]
MENNYDALIIGSGIAGLTTAINLKKKSKSVAIYTKAKIDDCATSLAQGGIVAVLGNIDSYKAHIDDTLSAGKFINDKKAVSTLSHESKKAIDFLENSGVVFDKDAHNNIITSLEAAHSAKRIVHSSDFTGQNIEKALINTAKKIGIDFYSEVFVTKLLVKNGICFGVTYINLKDKSRKIEIQSTNSKSIVLATGGLGQLYKYTTNPSVSTGDGIVLANSAGAKISNMEFIQFHPTALKGDISPLFLLSESLRGEGGYLVDKTRRRIFINKLSRAELSPRDELAQAIYQMEITGKEIFLLFNHLNCERLKKRFPNIYRELKIRELDLCRSLIPVVPAAHYLCGGVNTDLNGQTNVKNLYAVGEVANTGVHGANRLASNSLLEGVVFGTRVAQNILNKMSTTKHSINKDHFLPIPLSDGRLKVVNVKKVIFTKNDLQKAVKIRRRLQDIMWQNVGIIRHQNLLKTTLYEVDKMITLFKKKKHGYLLDKEVLPSDLIYFMETLNMLQVAKLITQSAISRKKSLGCHYIL